MRTFASEENLCSIWCGSCPAARRLVCIFTLPSVPCQRLTDLRHVYEHNRQADPSPLLTRLGTVSLLASRVHRLLSTADEKPALHPIRGRSDARLLPSERDQNKPSTQPCSGARAHQRFFRSASRSPVLGSLAPLLSSSYTVRKELRTSAAPCQLLRDHVVRARRPPRLATQRRKARVTRRRRTNPGRPRRSARALPR